MSEVRAPKDPEAAEIAKDMRTEDAARRGKLADADIDNLKMLHTNLYTLAAGSFERSKFAAETIQKASAAVAVLYTGVLGLVFSVTDKPLPLRGILAPVFLGLAIVLSSVYLTYLVPSPDAKTRLTIRRAVLEQTAYARLAGFIREIDGVVRGHIKLLGMALAALAVGLAFIALPFLGVPAWLVAPHTEAQVQKDVPWPTLDPAARELPEALSVELYKQQVAEVAALRADARRPATEPEPILYFVGLLAGGLAVTVAGSLLKPKNRAAGEAISTDS